MNNCKPPTEHQEQTALLAWAETHLPHDLRPLLFAIPNGGIRTPRNARTLKLEGVKRGVPDLFFAYPNGTFHGLFIEMKRRDPALSKVSKEQAEMISRLESKGFCASICYGCLDAINIIQRYLALKQTSTELKTFAERENQ